jgi:hypothetical protein
VGLSALLTLLGLLLASTAVLDATSDGWYRYYVFSELAHQPWANQLWVGFWRDDILHHQWPLLITILGGGLYLARRTASRSALSSAPAYYATAALGLLGSAWLSRLHTGGYANVLMPAYAATALLAGLTYGALLRQRQSRPIHALLIASVLLQLSLLVYPPGSQIPTPADKAAGAQLITRLRDFRGPVLVLRHPWYGTVAGKGSFAQGEAIHDVLRSAPSRGARALHASLQSALDADHIQAVVLDGSFDGRTFHTQLTRDFRLQPEPITTPSLYPLTDARTAPTLLYLRVHPAR